MVCSLFGATSQTYLDAAEPYQYGFQDPATPVMEGIMQFHHDLMFFLICIVISVMWLLARCVQKFATTQETTRTSFVHGTTLEILWTVIPAFLLMGIGIPSFALLYSMDEMLDPSVTLKIIGLQWYWHYEYMFPSDQTTQGLAFDSYIVPDAELELGQLRLLEVDNRVVLPTQTHIRLIITAGDVLHCWTIPSFGVKLDACPGRLNQTSMFIKREGVYYGQCSEICGVNHSAMPIVVEAVSPEVFLSWLAVQKDMPLLEADA